jgi:hypothetical protein
MSTLYWLPETPDWRDRVRGFGSAPTPTWAEAIGLSRHRLSFSDTNGLDGVVARRLRANEIEGAPAALRVALIGSATLTHLHAGVRMGGLRRGLRLETPSTPPICRAASAPTWTPPTQTRP